MKIITTIIASFLLFNISFSQSNNCNTATVINLAGGSACVNGTNENATSANQMYGFCNATPVNEVWYTYVSGGSQNDYVLTPGTLIDAELIIYTGACPSAPGDVLELCNTAVGGGTITDAWGIPAGTQVWVGVASTSLTDGSFELCIDTYNPPPTGGNGCAGALPVCSGSTVIDMSTINSSGTDPSCFGAPVNQDVWFTFDVYTGGTFEWSAEPTGASVGVELDWALFDITGGCPGVEIDCNYNYDSGNNGINGQTPGGIDEFNEPSVLVAGNTYVILVDFFASGTVGDMTFSVDGGTAVIAPTADFSINPSTVTCGPDVDITITDNSVGVPDWTFGDGVTFSGNNPAIHNYNTPGTYAITASIGGDCPSTHTEFAQLFGPTTTTITTIDETCTGDCDGEVSVLAEGGSGVYTYLWSPGGETTPTISNLCANTYDVVVNDATCGTNTDDQGIVGSNACCAMSSFPISIIDCYTSGGLLQYDIEGTVNYSGAPATGTLTVTDCLGNQQVFNPPFGTSTTFTVTGLPQNGLQCDYTAVFSDDLACTIIGPHTAPPGITAFSSNCVIGGGSVDGTITFDATYASGDLIVEIFDGTNTIQDVISLPAASPANWNIAGLDPAASDYTITYYYSDYQGCSQSTTIQCGCSADAGTYVATTSGSGNTDYVLCFNDQIDINTNNDFSDPTDVGPIGGFIFDPGIAYLIYSCAPTPNLDPTADACFEGIYTTTGNGDMNNINDLTMFGLPPGTFTDNTVYLVAMTMYNFPNLIYNANCWDQSIPYPVIYLPNVTSTQTQDCQAGTAEATIMGGHPEIFGTQFTASNLAPATANFDNLTCNQNGTISISGLVDGDNFSFDIVDVNNCPITISGTFTGTEDPSFTYDNYTICTNGTNPIVNITGDAGTFNFTIVSGGPTLDINTNTGTINVATSDPGVYDVTYTTNDPTCFSSSTQTITINETPTVTVIPDEAVCNGSDFSAVTFTGTPALGNTYDWTSSNTTIGLVASGSGDISIFTGVNSGALAITNTLTVTPTLGSCIGTSSTFDLTVNPTEDAAFSYNDGLMYCLTGTNDPTVNLTGTVGGTYTYTVNSGGPTLSLNPVTGGITLATSNIGSYSITYTTPGVCVETSNLVLSITDVPEANFSIQNVCLNGTSPLLNYTADDAGTAFPTIGSPGTFSELTNNPGINFNSSTGVIDLVTSIPGDYILVNSINLNGCAPSIAQDNITIYELPTATISGGQTICPMGDLSSINLQIDFTSTGPWNLNYTFNGIPKNIIGMSPTTINGATYGFGDYILTQVTDNNGCSIFLNGMAVIDSFSTPTVSTIPPYTGCEGDNLVIHPFSGTPVGNTYTWNMISGTDIGFGTASTLLNGNNIGSFTSTNPQNPANVIAVTPISSEGCIGSPTNFTVSINPLPTPGFTADKFEGCEPTTITFTDQSLNGNTYVWDFGDGTSGSGTPVSHTYQNAGSYDINLTVTSSQGCSASFTETDYINIYPTPVAAFAFTPENTDISHTNVEFTNSSLDGDYYEWNFGDNSPLNNETDPEHIYPDIAGQYHITLLVTNNNHVCRDSIDAYINIKDIIIYYVPNVFTPDRDQFNEVFKPIFTAGYDPYDYHLIIFNRWGEVIFESHDASVGWDGTYPLDGNLAQDGVYIWKIDFKETMSDKRHLVEGHVTLLK